MARKRSLGLEWTTTDNVRKETWRRLLEYANDEHVFREIVSIHGQPIDSRMTENYKKQAKQIRLSLIQAKEYMDSASNSSLVTAPNLLYYSTLSLCTACMLLNGTGEQALDKMRKQRHARHHGLTFSINEQAGIQEDFNFFKFSEINVEKNGFFQEWYKTISIPEEQLAFEKAIEENGMIRKEMLLKGYGDIENLNKLVGSKFSLWGLILRIPDLINDLERLNIPTKSAHSKHNIHVTFGKEVYDIVEYWSLTGNDQDTLEAISNRFRFKDNPKGLRFQRRKGTLPSSMAVSLAYTKNDGCFSYITPETRHDIDGNHFMFDNSFDTPEISDALMIAYGLGMICRYYPDIWVREIDSHSIASKIVENIVEKLSMKIPILALRLLSRKTIFISSLRSPTYE